MNIVRNGKVIKIVPKKYKDVVESFEFTSEKRRLQPDERLSLLNLILTEYFNRAKAYGNVQGKYAADKFLSCDGDFTIIKVNKRDSITEWRIKANGVEINVSADLVSDCPKEYLKHKNEF